MGVGLRSFIGMDGHVPAPLVLHRFVHEFGPVQYSGWGSSGRVFGIRMYD